MFLQKKSKEETLFLILEYCICFNLGITIAMIGTMLADDRRLGLLELELSRHHMEQESFTPFYDAGHLIKAHRQTLNDVWDINKECSQSIIQHGSRNSQSGVGKTRTTLIQHYSSL